MQAPGIHIITQPYLSPDLENIFEKITTLKTNIIKLRDENRDFEKIRDQYLIHLRQCMKDQETLKDIFRKLKFQMGFSTPETNSRTSTLQLSTKSPFEESQIVPAPASSGKNSPAQAVATHAPINIQQIQAPQQAMLQAQQMQLLQLQQQQMMMTNQTMMFPQAPPIPTMPIAAQKPQIQQQQVQQNYGAPKESLLPIITKHQQYLNDNAVKLKFSFSSMQIDSNQPFLGACFSNNGKLIAASTGPTVTLINIDTQSSIATIHLPQTSSVYEKRRIPMKFSVDDQLFCVGGNSCNCFLCHVQTGKVIQQFADHKKNITAIEFSPNGKWLITGSLDGVINIWSLQSFDLYKRLPQTAPIVSIVTSEDADLYAIGFKNGFVGIVNSEFEPPMNSFQAHESSLTCLDLSPLTTMIATTSEDSTTKIWSIMRGPASCKHSIKFHQNNPVLYASFSANDPILLTLGGDSTIAMQNYKTESLLYTVKLPYNEIFTLCHSPTSRTFLITGNDNTVKVIEYGSI